MSQGVVCGGLCRLVASSGIAGRSQDIHGHVRVTANLIRTKPLCKETRVRLATNRPIGSCASNSCAQTMAVVSSATGGSVDYRWRAGNARNVGGRYENIAFVTPLNGGHVPKPPVYAHERRVFAARTKAMSTHVAWVRLNLMHQRRRQFGRPDPAHCAVARSAGCIIGAPPQFWLLLGKKLAGRGNGNDRTPSGKVVFGPSMAWYIDYRSE